MTADWESEPLLRQMFLLLLGSEKSDTAKPEMYRIPASAIVRRRLVDCLLRSRHLVPNAMIASTAEIIFDCLDEGEHSNKKLMALGLDLVSHVAQHTTTMTPAQAVDILSRLVLFIYKKCPPDDANLKAKAFIALGNMVPKYPDFVTNDLAVLQQLFESLSEETGDVKMAVRTCLNSMAHIFVGSKVSGQLMEALLFENIEKNDAACRQVVIHYADAIYPKNHIPSRYIILQGLGDDDDTVKAEAQKAFMYCTQPSVLRDIVDAKVKMPAFIDFVNHDTHYAKKNPFVDVCRLIPVVEFIRLCLLAVNDIEGEDPLAYEEEADYRLRIVRNVRHYMAQDANSSGRRAVDTYFRLIQVVILTQPVTSHFTGYLQEVLLGHTKDLVTNCKQVFDKIRTNVLFTARGADCRSECATILALVALETETKEQLQATLLDYAAKLKAKEADTSQGALLGLCHLLDRLASRQRGMKAKGKLGLTAHVAEVLKETEARLAAPGKHPVCTVYCNGLSVLANAGLLAHLPPGGRPDEAWPNKLVVVQRLLDVVKAPGSDRLCREAALRALSGVAHGEPQMPHSRQIVDSLASLADQKDPELHLAIADCFCAVSLGSASPYRGQWFDLDHPLEMPTKCTEALAQVCQLSADRCEDTGPKRVAGLAWTWGLLKRMGRHQSVPLAQLHKAVAPALGDSDQLVQELACRCLCLLCDSLTANNQEVPELQGAFLTSDEPNPYAELVAICRAVNRRSLIYPLLNLAASRCNVAPLQQVQALATRRALRQLRPHTDLLVPRLYRYQFDSHPKLQPPMTAVWRHVISGEQSTIACTDRLLLPIVQELMQQLHSQEGRVRECSCLAVQSVLSGRQPDARLCQLLPKLCAMLLKLMDDTRDSVREAAGQAFQSCSKYSCRCLDANLLGSLLPVLLEHGVGSSVAEIRSGALRSLTELAQAAEAAALRPHLVNLVTALLQALSGLEPTVFVTFSQRLSGAAKEQVDMARMNAMQSTPVFELLKVCIRQIDQQTLEELVPHLTELIRKGVGLGTKCGTAHFVVALTDHCGSGVACHTGKLLAALLYGVADRNPVVQRSMALAIGHLVSYARQASVEKLLNRVRCWYLEKEDEFMRRACGQIFHECARFASDILRRHSASALPLIFLASADESADDASVWKDAWTDCSGSVASLSACLSELLNLCSEAVRSRAWQLRRQAALALKKLANQLELGVERTQWLLAEVLTPALQAGKTWDGRHLLCEAAAALCVRCPALAEDTRTECLQLLLGIAERQADCLLPAAQLAKAAKAPVLHLLWDQVQKSLPASLPALSSLWIADSEQQSRYLPAVCQQLIANDKELQQCLKVCRELVELDVAISAGGVPPEPLAACAQHLLGCCLRRRAHFQDALHLITCLVTCTSPAAAHLLSEQLQSTCTEVIDLAEQHACPSPKQLRLHFQLLQEAPPAAAAAAAADSDNAEAVAAAAAAAAAAAVTSGEASPSVRPPSPMPEHEALPDESC